MQSENYHELLLSALRGRKIHPDYPPIAHRNRPMLSFWGEEAGMVGGDIHAHRAYRLYLDYNDAGIIEDASLVIEGDLISPCSGYWYETLDELDYKPVLDWCLSHTLPREL